MQLLPNKGLAIASSLGTPHMQTNRVTPDCQGLRGEQDTVLQKSWRAGSVFPENQLSLLFQICSHRAHQAQGL